MSNSFIHSIILETYIAPLQEISTGVSKVRPAVLFPKFQTYNDKFAFSVDLTTYLNDFNLRMQGETSSFSFMYMLIVIVFPHHNLGINSLRGVQYVHCVMHKCIMVKLGGTKNTMYVKKKVKKTRKFYEIRGKFEKVKEIIIFPK